MKLADWAYGLSESLLAELLPRRWEHCKGVAGRAEYLSPIFGAEAEVMYAAAVLHDIGYSPLVAAAGFHPLDGARYLRHVVGADERVVRLVAHHTCALMEAEERGLRDELAAEFEPERDDLVDALIYCDMTTTPDGTRTNVEDRIAEVVGRYGIDSIVGRFIRRAKPALCAACARTEARLAAVSGAR